MTFAKLTLWLAVLILSWPIAACAAEATYPGLAEPVTNRGDITYLDLVRQIVPDIAEQDGVYTGHAAIPLLPVDGSDEASEPPDPISIYSVSALPIMAEGKPRLLILADLGQAEDSAQGVAALALFDLAARPKLLDAVDVAYDRDTSFRTPASFPISPGNDVLLTFSTHSNSNQSYVTSLLLMVEHDRIKLIDSVFTFDDTSCSFARKQVPAFKAVKRPGSAYADIEAGVTETTTPSGEDCEGEDRVEASTRRISTLYRWDAATARYATTSDALERLAKENAERF